MINECNYTEMINSPDSEIVVKCKYFFIYFKVYSKINFV